jgi:RND family efflux transporter MFP subunit
MSPSTTECVEQKMRHVLSGFAGFLGIVLILGCSSQQSGMAKKDSGPPLVTVAKPVVKTVTQFKDVNGTMKARERVEIRAQVSGFIEQIHFKDGTEVKAGDVLITIDPSLYKADLDKADSELANSKAQEKLALSEEARFTRLRMSGSVSQDEFEQSVAKREVASANVKLSQANVDRAKKNLEWTKVTAPISGRIDRILLTKGNLVLAGASQKDPLTVIVSTDPIYAYVDLDEQSVLYYLDLINTGKFQSVRERRIPIEVGLKDGADYPYKGELEFAGTELNPSTGSLTLRGEVPNPAPWKFTPGMFVRVRLPGAVVPNSILISDVAIVQDQNKRIVYVVGADNKVATREVQIGPISEGLRVIRSGLTPEDRVIIRGLQRVQDGVTVEAQTAEMLPTK